MSRRFRTQLHNLLRSTKPNQRPQQRLRRLAIQQLESRQMMDGSQVFSPVNAIGMEEVDLPVVQVLAPGCVEIQGTPGNDSLAFDAADLTRLVVNGNQYSVGSTPISSLNFDGGNGLDKFVFTGTAASESFTLWPDHGTVTGLEYSVDLQSVENVSAVGNGGEDIAYLTDSPSDDEFFANKERACLSGEGFQHEFFAYPVVHAYARAGGADSAFFDDSGQRVKFKGLPNVSKIRSGAFYARAKFFDTVCVTTTGGNDLARLWGSDGDDQFFGQSAESSIRGDEYVIETEGIAQVIAYAMRGNDVAYLLDSPGDDTVRARSHKTMLYDSDTKGKEYSITARCFDTVHAQAVNGGFDMAKLHDTAGDDIFEATGDRGSMSIDGGSADLLYDAEGFETVKIYSSAGSDRKQNAEETDFALLVSWFTVNWNLAGLRLATGERHRVERIAASCCEGLSL